MSETDKRTNILVGLGNPGPRYQGTRHNIGFEVLREFAKRQSADLPTTKFEGEIASCFVEMHKLILVWPMTYMNLSGRCVAAVAKFYKIDPEQDLLVVCDDISLPLGKIRVRQKGSAGGQKGLQDILRAMGTQSIARLRIGVDPPPPRWDAADYVLGKFREEERPTMQEAVNRACRAIEDWMSHDLAHCMNKFN